MSKRRKLLVVGNWKMNPATLARAEKLFVDIEKGLKGRQAFVELAIAPPLPFITELQQLAGPQKIEFAAQDVSAFPGGAYTGSVGTSMLRSIGVRCAIVGHSERRKEGETDEQVNEKLRSLLAEKLTGILCVGETERDGQGDYFSLVEEQLGKALEGVTKEDIKRVIVAYEPVWAIGTGKNARPEDVEEMRLFINKILTDLYGREAAEGVRVLYGGSVTPDNAEGLLEKGAIDGFLVGSSSLDAKKFVAIVKMADHYAKLA